MEIVQLGKDDWEVYKALSLDFFKSEPFATGYSYEDEVQQTDVEWQEIFNDLLDKESAIVLVAKEQDKNIGIIIGLKSEEKKMKHIGFISRFYVDKNYRGQGIGKKLFSALLEKLESDPSIVKLNLDVTTTQTAAISLYKSFGFEIIGEFKKEYLIEGEFYNTYEMEKYLNK